MQSVLVSESGQALDKPECKKDSGAIRKILVSAIG